MLPYCCHANSSKSVVVYVVVCIWSCLWSYRMAILLAELLLFGHTLGHMKEENKQIVVGHVFGCVGDNVGHDLAI